MSINDNFTIFRDVPVIYEDEHGDRYYGDIPIITRNDITGDFETVINNRGYGYAGRHRMCYRKCNKKEDYENYYHES